MTTQARHARFSDMASDVKARLDALRVFAAVEKCNATKFEDVAEMFRHVSQYPVAIVVIGPADYPTNEPRAPAQRIRETQVGILIACEYSAEADSGAVTVWDLEDAVDRSFTPLNGDRTPIKINDVYYSPDGSMSLKSDDGFALRWFRLKATDPVQERTVLT